MKHFISVLVLLLLGRVVAAEVVFVEAETFSSPTNAWRVAKNSQTRSASHVQTIHGASGDQRGVASKRIAIEEPGTYRVWVRYLHHERYRGAFRLAIGHDGKPVAVKDFDTEPMPGAKNWEYVWEYVDAELPAAEVELELSKFEQKNCSSYVRHIDCVLLTDDKTLVPSHLPYGPQTYLRVTLGDVYEEPVYVHVFADHYRSPWYQHFHHLRKPPAESQTLLIGPKSAKRHSDSPFFVSAPVGGYGKSMGPLQN